MQKDPMLDEDFLKELSEFKHRFIWTKIISLNLEEDPIEEITGRVTNGSINVDGTSTVRRTCSLTLVAKDVNINDYYWSLKTKFKVYIGLENHINSLYPDIIWFKQGTFLITSFSCSVGVNNYTISIQGKDKMSLLNGEFGGVIPSTWDFGTMDETKEDGVIENTLIPIKDIVLQAVHEYAQEPWQNIIVNDLDDYGIELLEYIGNKPFYYVIGVDASGDNDSREVAQMIFNPDQLVSVQLVDWINDGPSEIGWTDFEVKISELENFQDSDQMAAAGASTPPTYCYEKLLEQLDPSGAVTETKNYWRTRVKFKDDDKIYTIAKIEKDNGLEVCGYRICDIVYPYELIEPVGSTITTMLDKLIKMLGNFEYFYDTDGRFIFQKKRTFLDVSYNNIIGEHSINQEIWVEDNMFNSKYSYVFDENTLISSIQNNPNIGQIKNDYSLWGNRKQGDTEVPIHMRYAIDHKPMWYKSFDGKIYATKKGIDEYKNAYNNYIQSTNGSLENQLYRGNNRVLHMRDSYPLGLSESWFKLDDWLFLYGLALMKMDGQDVFYIETNEQLKELGYYPEDNVNMSFSWGNKKVLLEGYYQTIGDLKSFFDFSKLGIYYGDDYRISIFDTDQNLRVTSVEHGYQSCSHSYTDLLKRQDPDYRGGPRIIWVYDPRLTGTAPISDKSILTDDISSVISQLEKLDEVNIVDWREIIYQMANDYRRYYRDDDFLITLRDNNKWTPRDYLYPKGYTGYEKYYVDFEMNLSQGVLAYWRELYNPEAINSNAGTLTRGHYLPNGEFKRDSNYALWNSNENYNKDDYVSYISLNEDTQKLEKHIYRSATNENVTEPTKKNSEWILSDGDFTYNSSGWNVDILNAPEALNFWFDFLDTDGKLNAYGVNNIGQRTKAANDTDIKSIYFRETPNVIFDFGDEDIQKKWLKPGYSYINIPKNYGGIFSISSRGKNAMDVIEDYLYQYAFPCAAVSFNSIPIYYLTPNTLIYLNDKKTGAVGEYILQKYSIQLGLASQMSVSAVETAKRLY